MNRAQFWLARATRDEAALQRLSVSQNVLLEAVKGRSVALVGNSKALVAGAQGAEIDGHDLIVRINRAPMPSGRSHGTRTDWLGLGMGLDAPTRDRLRPDKLLWMPAKRRRLGWDTARSPGFYLHPREDVVRLGERLGAKPTTGALLIDLLLRSGLGTLTLYGFDFFATGSLSGRRTAQQVPHDFTAEARWVADLMRTDPRLTRR